MEEYKKVTISFTKDQLEKMDEIMSKEQAIRERMVFFIMVCY